MTAEELTMPMIERARRAWAATKVILASVVTLATAAAAGLTEASEAIVAVMPDGTGQSIARWLLIAAAWLTAAVAALRRVTPVNADERGVLPGR